MRKGFPRAFPIATGTRSVLENKLLTGCLQEKHSPSPILLEGSHTMQSGNKSKTSAEDATGVGAAPYPTPRRRWQDFCGRCIGRTIEVVVRRQRSVFLGPGNGAEGLGRGSAGGVMGNRSEQIIYSESHRNRRSAELRIHAWAIERSQPR